MLNESELGARVIEPTCSTLLALVQSLTDEASSPEEVVEIATELVDSRRVILIGNFRGCQLQDSSDRPEWRPFERTRQANERSHDHSGYFS